MQYDQGPWDQISNTVLSRVESKDSCGDPRTSHEIVKAENIFWGKKIERETWGESPGGIVGCGERTERL